VIEIASWDRPFVFDGEPWKDGLVYYGCDEDGVVVHPPQLCEVATEDGETIWLPKAWFSRGRAKAAVSWRGSDPNLDCAFVDVRCTSVWLRREDRYEDGYRLDAWVDPGCMYYPCKPGDEHAIPFWRLESARR